MNMNYKASFRTKMYKNKTQHILGIDVLIKYRFNRKQIT